MRAVIRDEDSQGPGHKGPLPYYEMSGLCCRKRGVKAVVLRMEGTWQSRNLEN